MGQNKINLLLITILLFGVGLACSSETGGEKKQDYKKLESYTLRGLKFSYYKIPAGLSREQLIKTAQEIHEREPDTQLILVDDDSGLADYVKYVQEFSRGSTAEAKLPKEWADAHIVANVQKLLSGSWRLCKSYGYEEIADLK